MKLKKIILLFVINVIALVALTGCDTSDKLVGTWHSLDADNKIGKVIIEDNAIIINGIKFKTSQNAIGIHNGLQYYGIQLHEFNDRKKLISIIFPKKEEKDKAIILVPNDEEDLTAGTILAVISKKQFKNKDYSYWLKDYFKLKVED